MGIIMKKEPKFIKFVDAYGNETNFPEDAPEQQVKERLSWMGKIWVKVKDNNIEEARMKAKKLAGVI